MLDDRYFHFDRKIGRIQIFFLVSLTALICGIGVSYNTYIIPIMLLGSVYIFYVVKKPVYTLYTVIILLGFRDINIIESFQLKAIDIAIIISVPFIMLTCFILRVEFRVYKNNLILSSVIFILYVLSSIMWSEDLSNGKVEAVKLALATTLLFLPNIYIKDTKHFVRALEIWLYAAFASSIYNLVNMDLQSITFDFFNEVSEFYGFKASFSNFYRDGNDFAMYLILTFVLFEVLKILNPDRKKVYNWLIIPILLNWIFALSRSGWIVGLLAYLLLILVKNKDFIKKKKFLLISAGSFVLSLSLIFIVANKGLNLKADWSFFSRFYLWESAIELFKSNLIFGVGIGAYQYNALKYIADPVIQLNPYPHNLILRVLAEFGFIGFLAFLCQIISLYKLKIMEPLSEYKLIRNVFLVGITAYLMQGFVVEFLSSRYFWMFLGLYNCLTNIKYESNK
ncbi:MULTISPECIES: O-antigen ligase family protein [unclassified Bacillus cereus group]|uniref:O-antigen ligase family protein n=1 Tax=unclassified Bacillus cereus group TaxID=2750818 RepID=UPI0022DF35D7|nr:MULTISPECIES: O-antigen ligase family protein [unclassified Bacillus cereus group]MDA2145240.1 O-antigen ligase family protein [Bacillus cereus group sp. Bc248]MDA2172660.1 O-antigen ligase family protein [Bacillus cereus group sp. Bc247]